LTRFPAPSSLATGGQTTTTCYETEKSCEPTHKSDSCHYSLNFAMRAISAVALSGLLAQTSAAIANPSATELSPLDSPPAAPAFSYPESAQNGWPKSCESDPVTTEPSNPPPEDPQQSPIDFTRLTPVQPRFRSGQKGRRQFKMRPMPRNRRRR
jgi:hypothetical protein